MSDQQTAAPGWYRPPGDTTGSLRYWDGNVWTEHVTAPDRPIDLRGPEHVAAPTMASAVTMASAASEPSTATAPIGSPTRSSPASWQRRAMGRLVDHLILSPAAPAGYLARTVAWEAVVRPIVIVTLFTGWVVLDTVFVGRLGGTPGKLLFGLRVVDAETDTPATSSQALRRAALGVFSFSTLPLAVALLDLSVPLFPIAILLGALIALVSLLMLFGGERRTIHDRVGGTRVVEMSSH